MKNVFKCLQRPCLTARSQMLMLPIENRLWDRTGLKTVECRSIHSGHQLLAEKQKKFSRRSPPKKEQKSVRVSIIGKPNSGKSTLLNSLLQQYISPVSPMRQTTVENISAVVTYDKTQVVFVDTPGILPGQFKQARGSKQIEKISWINSLEYIHDSFTSVDVVILMVDASSSISKLYMTEDVTSVLESIPKNIHRILALNKVDKVRESAKLRHIIGQLTEPLPAIPVPSIATRTDLDPGKPYFIYEENRKDGQPFDEVIELSALRGQNVNYLWYKVRQYAVQRPWKFPRDTVSPDNMETVVKSVVRAELLTKLGYGQGLRIDHSFIGAAEQDGKLIVEHAIFKKGQILPSEELNDSKANIEKILASRFGMEVEFILVMPWHKRKEDFLETISLDSEPTIETVDEFK